MTTKTKISVKSFSQFKIQNLESIKGGRWVSLGRSRVTGGLTEDLWRNLDDCTGEVMADVWMPKCNDDSV
jgi:hypothetical protein